MIDQETLDVSFPDGSTRRVKPVSWKASKHGGGPPTPVFDIPGYDIVEAVGGKFYAYKALGAD